MKWACRQSASFRFRLDSRCFMFHLYYIMFFFFALPLARCGNDGFWFLCPKQVESWDDIFFWTQHIIHHTHFMNSKRALENFIKFMCVRQRSLSSSRFFFFLIFKNHIWKIQTVLKLTKRKWTRTKWNMYKW